MEHRVKGSSPVGDAADEAGRPTAPRRRHYDAVCPGSAEDAGITDLVLSLLERELADLLFAWKVVKMVKSNAIVFARDDRTVGVGAGQMARVTAVGIAAAKAGELSKGAVMASDAFFPFPDGIEAAAAAGIRAIAQPGGSKRDDQVIAAADAAGIAMVLTGFRHFRH